MTTFSEQTIGQAHRLHGLAIVHGPHLTTGAACEFLEEWFREEFILCTVENHVAVPPGLVCAGG